MDIQSVTSSLHNFARRDEENQCCYLKDLFNIKDGPPASNCKQDALEAVKLDPAVLEAQVTVHSKEKGNVDGNESRNINDTDKGALNVAMATPVSEIDASSASSNVKGFSDMMLQHKADLLSLPPHQLAMLMDYVSTLRMQRTANQKQLSGCAFCKNNGKPVMWYTSHALKDGHGRVRCPVLRAFRCPRCGATGDRAHTIKYCPDLLRDSLSSPENLLL